MLKLIPVIEFDPGMFRTQEHPFPSGSRDQDPQGWQKYSKLCWADSGIVGLKTYRSSVYVRLDDVDDRTLSILLERHLDFDPSCDLPIIEQVGSLPGGYILDLGGDRKIWPQCCGALENWREWEEVCETSLNEEKDLWIGHPQLVVQCRMPDRLQLRETQEHNVPAHPKEFVVARQELRSAIETVKSQLGRFETRLVQALKAAKISHAEAIAVVLVSGHEAPRL